MHDEKKRKLVTIVSDEKLRSLLQDFMSGDDYGVESAQDGLDAFHKLAKKYFDLIITDVQMPGLGGVNLLPRLKQIQPWARVIVIPTRRITRKERPIVESAADVCLEKPFELNQLKTVIQGMFPPPEGKVISTEEGWKRGRLSWQPG
jgi:two-component system, NtrC family, response regulator PilR